MCASIVVVITPARPLSAERHICTGSRTTSGSRVDGNCFGAEHRCPVVVLDDDGEEDNISGFDERDRSRARARAVTVIRENMEAAQGRAYSKSLHQGETLVRRGSRRVSAVMSKSLFPVPFFWRLSGVALLVVGRPPLSPKRTRVQTPSTFGMTAAFLPILCAVLFIGVSSLSRRSEFRLWMAGAG